MPHGTQSDNISQDWQSLVILNFYFKKKYWYLNNKHLPKLIVFK